MEYVFCHLTLHKSLVWRPTNLHWCSILRHELRRYCQFFWILLIQPNQLNSTLTFWFRLHFAVFRDKLWKLHANANWLNSCLFFELAAFSCPMTAIQVPRTHPEPTVWWLPYYDVPDLKIKFTIFNSCLEEKTNKLTKSYSLWKMAFVDLRTTNRMLANYKFQ